MLNGKVQTVVETKSPGLEQAITQLRDAVLAVANKKGDDVRATARNDARYAQSVVQMNNEIRQPKKEDKSNRKSPEITYLQKIAKATNNLWKASQSQNTIWVGVSKFSSAAQKDIAQAIADCCRNASKSFRVQEDMANTSQRSARNLQRAVNNLSRSGRAGGGGGGGGGGGVDAGGSGGSAGGGGGRGRGNSSLLNKAGVGAFVVLQKLVGDFIKSMDINPFEKLFDGIFDYSQKHRMNMRALIHMMQGYSAANREIEESYRTIASHAAAAGVTNEQFSETWQRNLERGLVMHKQDLAITEQQIRMQGKELRGDKVQTALLDTRVNRLKSIQTSAVATARALNINADMLNDMFMDWHYHLGLSASEMAEMGRAMQDISRTTGVTGKQLEKAMQSTDAIQKSLKSAGLASVETGRNVTQFLSAMQKHGAGEEAQQIMQAISSRQNFFNADPRIKAMLSRAGKYVEVELGISGFQQQLQNGLVAGNKQAMRYLMQGERAVMKDFLKQWWPILKEFGLKDDLTNFSQTIQAMRARAMDPNTDRAEKDRLAQIIGNINTLSQQNFTIDPGGFENLMRGMEEATQTSSEKITLITNRLQDLQRQGLGDSPEARRQQQLLQEAQQDQMLNAFGTVQRAIQQFGGDQARLQQHLMSTLGPEMGEEVARQFTTVEGRQGQAEQLMQIMAQRAQATGKNFNDLLQEQKVTREQLIQGIASGNENFLNQVNTLSQEIGTENRAAQDPITAIQQNLLKIANKIREKIEQITLWNIPNNFAKLIFWITTIAVTLTSALALFRGGQMFKGLIDAWSRMRGGGGDSGGGIGGRGGIPPTEPLPSGRGTVMPTSTTTVPGIPGSPAASPKSNRTIGQGGFDMGGRGWSGAAGVEGGYTTGANLKGMSRADRIANAQRYLEARRRVGQSGTVRGMMKSNAPRTGYIRIANQTGRGARGRLGRALNFLSRYSDIIGTAATTAAGAGAGYYLSDGNLIATAIGGTGGFMAGRSMFGRRGWLEAGGLPNTASQAARMLGGSGGLEEMPGFGEKVVPVFVTNMGSGLGGGMGMMGMMGMGAMGLTAGSGWQDYALGGIDIANHIADANNMLRGGRGIANIADDAARAGGRTAANLSNDAARLAGGVRGTGATAARAAANLSDDAARAVSSATRAGGMLSKVPGRQALTRATQAVTTRAGSAIGAVTQTTTRVLGSMGQAGQAISTAARGLGVAARGIGTVASKAAGPLSLVVAGGIMGAMEAEQYGRSLAEGAIFGALTGGAGTGSMFSGAVGIEQGSSVDEALGVLNAAGYGAITGAAIGSTTIPIPIVGTAVGAGVGALVGAGAELVKIFTDENSALRQEVLGIIQDGWDKTGEAFEKAGKTSARAFNQLIEGDVLEAIGSAFTSGVYSIEGVIGTVSNIAKDTFNSAVSGFTGGWDATLKQFQESGQRFDNAWNQLWEGDIIGALGSTVQGAWSSVKGMFSAAGSVASKIYDDVAALGTSIVDIGKGIGKDIGNVASGIGDVILSGFSAVGSLFGFAEGTPRIASGGLAFLHPGEMVIPADLSKTAAPDGMGVRAVFGALMEAAQPAINLIGGGLTGALQTAYAAIENSGVAGSVSALALGAFQKGESKDALDIASNAAMQMANFMTGGLLTPLTDLFGSLFKKKEKPSWIDSIVSAVTGAIESMPNSNFITSIGETVSSAVSRFFGGQKLGDAVSEVFGIKSKEDKENLGEVSASLKGAFEKGEAKEAVNQSLVAEMNKQIAFLTEQDIVSKLADMPELVSEGVDHKVASRDEALFSAVDEMVAQMRGLSSVEYMNNVLSSFKEFSGESKSLKDIGNISSSLKDVMSENSSVSENEVKLSEESQVLRVHDATVTELLKTALSVQEKTAEKTADVTASLQGAFQKGEAKEATETSENVWMKSIGFMGSVLTDPIGTLTEAFASLTSSGGIRGLIGDAVSSVGSAYMGMADTLTGGMASSITRFFSKTASEASSVFGIVAESLGLGGVGSVLQNAFESYTSSTTSMLGRVVGGMGMGLFEKNQASEAIGLAQQVTDNTFLTTIANAMGMGGVLQVAKEAIMGLSAKTKEGEASQLGEGLFDITKISEAVDSSVTDVVNKTVDRTLQRQLENSFETYNERERERFRGTVEATKALYYEQAASDAALAAQNGMTPSGNMGDMKLVPMDYRDELRGEVGILGLTPSSLQTSLEQRRAGDQTTATAIAPGMDGVEEYLTRTQAKKLDMLISLMQQVVDNTAQRVRPSSVIGPESAGVMSGSRPGVKNIARDVTRGFWDLVFSDTTPGYVFSDGRGGSA
jgi:hypothetical protein